MKNMYALKCLYQSKFYNKDGELLGELLPNWEERIILVKGASFEEVELKSEKFAKKYETEYLNNENQIVKVRLYEIIDIFAVFDTNDRTNIEVYSKMFEATEEQVKNMLDVEYPTEQK